MFTGLLAGGAVAIAVIYWRWRLRVDDTGIAFRRLWRWQFWPWDAFAGGEVSRGADNWTFRWGKQKLSFELFSEEDRQYLIDLCREVWVAPPRAEAPGELAVSVTLRCKLQLDQEGILVRAWGRRRHYRWAEVIQLRIVQPERGAERFIRLELRLPQRTIPFLTGKSHGLETTNWTGADALALRALLEAHVPSDRIRVINKEGPTESLDDLEGRIEELEQLSKVVMWQSRVLAAMTVTMIATIAFSFPGNRIWGTAVLLLTALTGGVAYCVIRQTRNRLAAQRRQIERLRTEFGAADAAGN